MRSVHLHSRLRKNTLNLDLCWGPFWNKRLLASYYNMLLLIKLNYYICYKKKRFWYFFLTVSQVLSLSFSSLRWYWTALWCQTFKLEWNGRKQYPCIDFVISISVHPKVKCIDYFRRQTHTFEKSSDVFKPSQHLSSLCDIQKVRIWIVCMACEALICNGPKLTHMCTEIVN